MDSIGEEIKKELMKLVSFAYDLYQDKLTWYGNDCSLFPRKYTYNHESYETCRIKDGIIWGFRSYPHHGTSVVFTQLGLTVGRVKDGKLEFDYAINFETNSRLDCLFISLLDCKEKEIYEPKLENTSSWENLSREEQVSLFIKSMAILGFHEEDVRDLLEGKLNAREVYMKMAPEEKKYKQWVNVGRRYFWFDKNVAISGSFNSINFDKFPFPFEGEVVIDCSKASTAGMKLENNHRKVKMININDNPNSIRHANLRNAIIEEVIDLSKVDATGTKFGHQVVSNMEWSKADMNTMDLTLACDIEKNRFEVDDQGIVKVDFLGTPYILNSNRKTPIIKVFANVDNKEMLEQAFINNCDGVGLVRTETLFMENTRIEKYRELLLEKHSSLLEEFKKEQGKLIETIVNVFPEEKIVIRLFDFRFYDFFKEEEVSLWDDCDRNCRGLEFLYKNSWLLKAQLESIFEVCKKYHKRVSLLIPFIEDIDSLEWIKGYIKEVNKSYDIEYDLGAMIENNSSVQNADRIAKKVDFISIGMNDLTENILGKTRNSKDIDFSYLNEEVKNAMKEAIYRARAGKGEIEISLCGEHTNYIENLDFFCQLDINAISVHPLYIESIKSVLEEKQTKRLLK